MFETGSLSAHGICQALQTCIFTTSSSSGERLALFQPMNVALFFSMGSEVSSAHAPSFLLALYSKEPIPPSPEMDGLCEELSKPQAPKATSGFPG